jgi:glycosyltransferase involved in cell wall biosynthesis
MSVSAPGLPFAPPSVDFSGNATTAKLNVLAVIDHLAVGGAEMLLSQFAAAAPHAGIRLSVAYLEDSDASPAARPLREAGISPVGLGLNGRPSGRHLLIVRRHIRAQRPDIVHTHLGTSDLLGGLAAKSLGIPAISTIHGVKQRPVGVLPRLKSTIFSLSQRYCAARVIVVSDCARRAYLAHSPGMNRRVVRIYNGADLTPSPGSGARVRRELGVKPEELLVGMLSALRPEKGHDLAIQTIALLRERFPNLRLLIVGQGAYATQIAELTAPLGDRVILAGLRTDVADVLDALDVCIHPSYMDAFPTTLIEALATRVPILATAVGGIPEIIDNGQTGVLVSAPTDPGTLAGELSRLLEDPSRRKALADAGQRSYLQRFTARPWILHTRALYDSVLTERHAKASNKTRPSPMSLSLRQ